MNRGGLLSKFLFVVLCVYSSLAVSAVSTSALIAARNKFFGAENVNQLTGAMRTDKVIVSWVGNATDIVSLAGRVILLDTYINRPELPTTPIDTRRSPVLPQDLINAKPEAIFLGHGHGDHADHAAYISKMLNDIPIYSTPETCDVMQQDVARMFADPNTNNNGGVPSPGTLIPNGNPANCIGVVPRGSTPGEYVLSGPNTGQTTVEKINQLEPLACILVFKHIHSGTAAVDPTITHFPIQNVADPRDAGKVFTTPATTYVAMYPTGTSYTLPGINNGSGTPNYAAAVPGQQNTETTGFGGTAGPYSLFYQFVLRSGYNFTLVWHNTTGPLKEGVGVDPGLTTNIAGNAQSQAIGAALFKIMDNLPPTDVELGSVATLGLANNGLRDAIMYNQHLLPKVFIPLHMTDVDVASSSPEFKIGWTQYAAALGFPPSQQPELHWLVDPIDFFKPQVFAPADARWFNPNKASVIKSSPCAS
jgi:hypothetical protein